MSLIKIANKGSALNCSEIDANFDYTLDLGNATGQLDCAKISQSSLSTCLSANSVIIEIQACINDNSTAIGEVAQDLTDAQTVLQGNINSLITLINNQTVTIADLTSQIASLTSNFSALTGTVAAFNSRLLSVEGRLLSLEQAIAAGIIALWSGSIINIPGGWQLCNGTNGTPDLRDRFVVGSGTTYAVNNVGGTTSHNHTLSGETGSTSLTVNQMPSHIHGITDPGHRHFTLAGTNNQQGPFMENSTNGNEGPVFSESAITNININPTGANGGHTHTLAASTGSASILPPYYALAYIMKL